jgi:type IV secretion/conjugal transfer VirB4 family ATPase
MTFTTTREFKKESDKKKGPLSERVSPCAFVNDTTVLTKRGDIFSVLEIQGIDAECLEPSQIDDVCRRYDSALRILGTNYRVSQYLSKRSRPKIDITSTDRLERARQERMSEQSGTLYSISLHIVVLRMRPLSQRITQSFYEGFFIPNTLQMLRGQLNQEVESLDNAVRSLCVQLSSTVQPKVLGASGILQFLAGLVNLTAHKANAIGNASTPKWHLDQLLPLADLENWTGHLKQDDYYIKMLSMVQEPARTIGHMLKGLLVVPCEMIICNEWKRESNLTVRREIDKKRRHYHLAKTSILSYTGKEKPQAHEVLIDDSKTAVVTELNRALEEMEVKENFFGRLNITIELFHEQQHVLSQAASRIFEIFHTYDAKVVEERRDNRINAWSAMLPGNYAYKADREMLICNQNYADLSFLFQPATGNPINEHLGRPALALLETKDSTLYNLNPHVQDVGHTLIAGSIGSGKSFLTNFLISSYQKYEPYTYIFDLGGSYRKLTNHYEGGYLHIGKASDVVINPFSLEPTKENLDFLFDFVRVLIEREGATLSPDQGKDLHERIQNLYVLDPQYRTLSNLADTCQRTYSRRLDQWIRNGRLAQYFDHNEDNLTLARFQTFDFESMDKPEVLEPLLFYILHRANATIYDPAMATVPKLFVLDEAWRFFNNPITRAYIHEALKTWRKRNALMILATQSADDLVKSQLLSTVLESCMTRIFLANPGMDAEVYKGTFGLNSTEAALVAKLEPKKQFLIKQPAGAKVLNLNVDPTSYNVFAMKGTL